MWIETPCSHIIKYGRTRKRTLKNTRTRQETREGGKTGRSSFIMTWNTKSAAMLPPFQADQPRSKEKLVMSKSWVRLRGKGIQEQPLTSPWFLTAVLHSCRSTLPTNHISPAFQQLQWRHRAKAVIDFFCWFEQADSCLCHLLLQAFHLSQSSSCFA